MINMFSHMACICHFVFYVLPRASYVYIQCVHSQCSLEVLLYFFQLFRCRKLALNRVFSYFLVVGMFLYLGGLLDTPMFVHPLYICTPPYVCMPPVHSYAPLGVYTPPRGPPHASVLLHGFGTLHVVGGCFSVLGHSTPIWGCLPLNYTPTLHCWFSVHCYSQGYQFLCGPFPFY